jgi:hypothetical protein
MTWSWLVDFAAEARRQADAIGLLMLPPAVGLGLLALWLERRARK